MKTIDELKNDKGEIDSNAIKQIIPYDQPFLMIDKNLNRTALQIANARLWEDAEKLKKESQESGLRSQNSG